MVPADIRSHLDLREHLVLIEVTAGGFGEADYSHDATAEPLQCSVAWTEIRAVTRQCHGEKPKTHIAVGHSVHRVASERIKLSSLMSDQRPRTVPTSGFM